MFERSRIINLWVNNISLSDSLKQVIQWGMAGDSRFICFANVHMTIEAYTDESFRQALEKASLILPDGKPLALACKWLYNKKQERIAGMDFMPALLQRANDLEAKVFLYGSTHEVLNKLTETIQRKYPHVIIVGSISPPFKTISKDEANNYVDQINMSQAQFIFVSLGCPKQEKWMAENYQKISGVLLGVGGAFPVVAGLQKRSPEWMRRYSLEWMYRLMQEPRRLFRRYFYTNLTFIWLLLKQLIKQSSSIPHR